MKKLSKKLLSVLLVIAMLVPTGSLMVQTSAVSSYITSLTTSHRQYNNRETQQEDEMITKAYLHDAQYNVIDYDLNKGVEYSDWIYAGYKTGTNASDAIRGLKVYKGSSAPSLINSIINGVSCTFYPVSDIAGGVCNLNSNAKRGTSIFLYYTKDVAAGNPINSISVSSSIGSNCVTYFDSSSAAELNVGAGGDYIYINYTAISAGSSSDVPIGPQFPAGYDFNEDRYSFRNSNVADTISLDIYKDVFGEEKGETIYNAYERGKSTHGLCYGIAVTTGSLLLDVPSVDSFIRYVGPCKYIKDINMGTKCYELNTITAKNFIKYGYVTQFSTQAETEFGDCTALYNAVSDYVYNGGIPVTVSLKEYRYDSSKNEWSQTFGHRVLAVGIDGNNGIIIDDSNKGSKQTIYLTKDSNGNFTNEWTYSGYSETTNGTCIFDKNVGVARVIGYNTAIALPYLVLAANAQLDGYPDSACEDEYHEVDIETKKLDSEYNLVSVISDSYEIVSDDGYLSAIDKPEMGSEINDNNGDLYWINDSSNITVSNFNSNDNKVKFATNDVAVEVSICEDSTVEMSIDENSNSVIANLSIVEGKNYTIAFDTSDSEGNDVDISVTGTANSDKVTATETEDGIQVTGLNDITVTYETADGTAETTAKVDDGSTVNITVNDDENTVETDWQCKHPDDNHDGICDTCSEDYTKSCSCNCHGNSFMQFLHKILCFLYRIFGMEQYRYCGCGKAHW